MTSPALTLYGRQWCHLCDDLLAALEALRAAYAFSVKVIDVDSDPALEHRFNEIVPVLMWGDVELCRYHFDDARVRAALSGAEAVCARASASVTGDP